MLEPEVRSASGQRMLSPTGRCRAFDVGGGRIRALRGLLGRGAQTAGRRARRRRPDSGGAARYRRQPGRPHGEHRHAVGAGADRGVPGGVGRGGVDPSTVGMVEAHGTGTPVGDPLEYASLSASTARRARCALGSVKTNIGHTESAAGVMGLIKAVLALRHGVVPPNQHFTRAQRSGAHRNGICLCPGENPVAGRTVSTPRARRCLRTGCPARMSTRCWSRHRKSPQATTTESNCETDDAAAVPGVGDVCGGAAPDSRPAR